MEVAEGFRLGDWSVDPAGNVLSRDSATVRISPRATKVLLALAEHPGRVLSRQALLSTCWVDGFVGDEVLTHAVSELRRALGDDRRTPEYIETVSKSGYRLVAPVRRLEPVSPGEGSQEGLSVAVLPFEDLSPDGDQGYFCAGIAEELINALSSVDGMRVVSRTSALRYHRVELDVRTIGRHLGADVVIEGSVRRAQRTMRIAVRLTDTESGYHIGSEMYDREPDDVFQVQAEIAQNVVTYLRDRVDAVPQPLVRPRPPAAPSVEAYDIYLQGRHLFYRSGREATERACELFRRAIEVAPGYALALAGSANAHLFRHLYYGPAPGSLGLADEHSRLAVETDTELPEAHAARGLALATVHAGSPGEPWVDEFDAALRLRPGSFEALYLYGRTCLAEGRYVKAAELFEAARKAWPDDFHTTMLLAKAMRAAGDEAGSRVVSAESLAQIAYHLKLVADDPRALCDGFVALVELGRVNEAMTWADRVGRPGTPDTLRYYVACGLARARRHDRALAELTAVIDGGWSHARWLRHDPDWAILRDDPAFHAVLERLERPR